MTSNDRPGTLTESTVELLQTMIRNRCVNDGSAASGEEVRNADTLSAYLGGSGIDIARYESVPGRVSLVARIEGSDPAAPSLCLCGHTDVVPVEADGWSRDPFAGERVTADDGSDEVWGRGAVDMLNLTASMAVAMRHVAVSGDRLRGDLVFLAVADEEAGSTYGARWMAEHHAADITTDFVLCENGGIHAGTPDEPRISINTAEKGVAWRRLRIRGVPGHGSMPFRADNALVTAAGVVTRLAEYRPAPRLHELWRERVDTLGVDDDVRAALLDPDRLDEVLETLPTSAGAAHLHACSHTTFSPNVVQGNGMKTNVIPGTVDVDVDIRTMPGEGPDEVDAHLQAALGDLYDRVEVSPIMNDSASISPADTPLWDSIQRAVEVPFPGARLSPQVTVGFTDNRILRELGAVAYGAGLLSPSLDAGEFGRRFHGNDERIDVESIGLTTDLWGRVIDDFLG